MLVEQAAESSLLWRGHRPAAAALLAARTGQAFSSIHELALRAPELRKNDLTLLARIGALNSLQDVAHRRDALWQVAYAGRRSGPLLDSLAEEDSPDEARAPASRRPPKHSLPQQSSFSPLLPMSTEERLVADFAGTGVTVGRHPMAFHRERMNRMGIVPAAGLERLPHIGESIAAAIAQMVRTGRWAQLDRLRGELDFDVNRRAHGEIQGLAHKLNLIADRLGDIKDLLREKAS